MPTPRLVPITLDGGQTDMRERTICPPGSVLDTRGMWSRRIGELNVRARSIGAEPNRQALVATAAQPFCVPAVMIRAGVVAVAGGGVS